MDTSKLKDFIYSEFDKNAIPHIEDYIRIPNLSRSYDPEWATNGLLEKAAHFLETWVKAQNLNNLEINYVQEKGRTPCLYIEIQATQKNEKKEKNILMYGHFDKQPHMTGWNEGLHPTKPVIKDGKLYGRGGADDGYAIFTAILSIKALQVQNLPHPRIQILIEGDEESGSQDLPYYLEQLKEKIGNPDLIICLDSGAMDYDRLWITCSLRGVLSGTLTVKVLTEGVHSGDASGVVPSSFRLIRQLIERIENGLTGTMHRDLQVEIPADRYQQCHNTATVCAKTVFGKYPWHDKTQSYQTSSVEAYLNRCWRPQLSVTGVDGIPSLDNAGNVLRPYTSLKLSIRLPPTISGQQAADFVKSTLEKESPQGATVSFEVQDVGEGWNAPSTSKEMEAFLQEASKEYYGEPACFQGEGGSIPFMKMLGDMYPQAQFAVIGVLGPFSNAHGPNEFLHIGMVKNLTCCVSQLVFNFAKHP